MTILNNINPSRRVHFSNEILDMLTNADMSLLARLTTARYNLNNEASSSLDIPRLIPMNVVKTRPENCEGNTLNCFAGSDINISETSYCGIGEYLDKCLLAEFLGEGMTSFRNSKLEQATKTCNNSHLEDLFAYWFGLTEEITKAPGNDTATDESNILSKMTDAYYSMADRSSDQEGYNDGVDVTNTQRMTFVFSNEGARIYQKAVQNRQTNAGDSALLGGIAQIDTFNGIPVITTNNMPVGSIFALVHGDYTAFNITCKQDIEVYDRTESGFRNQMAIEGTTFAVFGCIAEAWDSTLGDFIDGAFLGIKTLSQFVEPVPPVSASTKKADK